MTNRNYFAMRVILIVALALGLAPRPASARGADDQRPIRLYARAQFGPIGVLKINSLTRAAASIDGRIARGEQFLWGGELVQVLGGGAVQVSFESMGSVTLDPSSAARFGAGWTNAGEASYPVLVATLEQGSMTVKLDRAAAYVKAGGDAFSASRQASFTVRVDEGRASVSQLTGVILAQDQPPPQDVNIRVVDELGRPVASGAALSVRARSTRQIQVQVTDKNDKPLPDLAVLFSLGDPCLGSLGLGAAAGQLFRQKTDKRGIATVPLLVGAARCSASIIAKVEGTNASVSIQTSVKPSGKFLSTRNTLLISAALVGAGVGAYFAVANSGSGSIKSLPPTVVKP